MRVRLQDDISLPLTHETSHVFILSHADVHVLALPKAELIVLVLYVIHAVIHLICGL